MKRSAHSAVWLLSFLFSTIFAQTPTSAPYCNGGYTTGQCNQPGASNAPGNFINDFINCVQTTGANTNINNCNSGCNGFGNNFAMHCSHYMLANPGQTINVSLQSGNTFGQGFAIFVDWNQDLTFNVPGEYVAGTAGVPAAGTFTTISFVIPATATPGAYRMRVRCAFATTGPNITPCGTHGFGETEDYTIYVGSIPSNAAIVSGTATANAPLCAGQTLSVNVAVSSTAALTYTWTGPNSFSNTNQNFMIANASPSLSGIYTVVVNNGNCPITATTAVQIVAYPNFSIVPSHTICQGGSIMAGVTFSPPSTSTVNFTFSWSPASGAGVFNANSSLTGIAPPLLPPSVPQAVIPYSVTVVPLQHSCPITHTMNIVVNNPLTPALTLTTMTNQTTQAIVCNNVGVRTFTGSPANGTWTPLGGNPNAVSPNGILNPSLAAIGTNTVQYSVSVGTCIVSNTGTYAVAKYNTPSLTGSISLFCSGQDGPFNLMSIVQNTFAGTWTGPSVNSLTSQFNYVNSPPGTSTITLKYRTISTNTPTTAAPISTIYASYCPDSTLINVQIFNPPTPTIQAIPAICNNAPQVNLNALVTPTGGVWTGNSAVTINGIQTPSLVTTFTDQTVLYTSGIGTCVASSTATFHVSKYNSPVITGTIINQCEKGSPVFLNPIAQQTIGGSWQGPGVNASPTLASSYYFNPAGLLTGVHTLTYNTVSTPIANLCPDSRTIAVSVLNPPVPNISATGPFCSRGAAVQMTVTPLNSGYWTNFPYMDPTGLFSPSLAAIGNNVVEYVTGTPTCSIQRTINVSVEAFIPSTISNKISDQCNTNPAVSLLPITISNMGIWSGAGILGSNFDPATAGAGVHVLTYKTASQPSGLCPDQSTLAVHVFSLATPVISQVGPFCNNAAPRKLLVTPIGGLFAGNNNGAINNEGLFNPALGIIGDNIITYSISAGPCVAFTQNTITIDRFVSAALNNAQPINFCQDDLPVNLNENVINPGGLWSSPVVGGIFDPKKVTPGTVLTVTYNTFPTYNPLLCPDASTVKITVSPTPIVTLAATPALSGCAPFEVNLDVRQAGSKTSSGKAAWFIGDGSELKEGLNISHTFTRPGTYTILANYSSDMGCMAQGQFETPITVFESPVVNFDYEPQEVTTANPEVKFNNQSNDLNSNRYRWVIEGMNLDNGDLNPVMSFTNVGTYRVKLIATSYKGCTDEMTKVIDVKNEFNVFIPNSFTPNFDGLNDKFLPVFSPYGLDSKNYELSIYDRWGHMIFSTKDPSKGWDGTFNNSSETILKQDSYNFFLKFKDLNGRVYNKSGSFMLMRN